MRNNTANPYSMVDLNWKGEHDIICRSVKSIIQEINNKSTFSKFLWNMHNLESEVYFSGEYFIKYEVQLFQIKM